jgi:predicted RNase H-like HicB family nuclease
MPKKDEYTVIVRKGKFDYVAICLELNIASSGNDLSEAERNLKDAIKVYLEDINISPDTVIEPISIDELIEFLRETEEGIEKDKPFRPFEIREVPVYV